MATVPPDREDFLRRLENNNNNNNNDEGNNSGASSVPTASTPTATNEKKIVRIDTDPVRIDTIETDKDDAALLFLKESGLGSSTIDPASLEALRALCGKETPSGKTTPPPGVIPEIEEDDLSANAANTNEDVDAAEELPPIPEIQTNAVLLRRVPSDLTQPLLNRRARGLRVAGGGEVDDYRTDATTVGDEEDDIIMEDCDGTAEKIRVRSIQAQNKMIMNQLEIQTALLMDMQRRLDELTAVVHTNNGNAPAQMPPQQQHPGVRGIPQEQPQQQGPPFLQQPVPQQQQHPREMVQPPLQEQQQAAAVAPAQMPLLSFIMTLFSSIMNLPSRIYHSKVFQIIRTFWSEQRRQVRLDGALIFKVVFMMMILSSKMKRNSKEKHGDYRDYQKYVLSLLVFGGFLIQIGYVQFLYNFFIKENVPGRIWNDGNNDDAMEEDPHNIGAAGGANGAGGHRRRHQRDRGGANIHNNNHNNNDADGIGGPPPPQHAEEEQEEEAMWRNNFIFHGRIHRHHPNDPPPNPFLAGMADALYIVGSFFLSILPMWKPEEMPRPDLEEDQDDGNEGDGNADPAQPEGREDNTPPPNDNNNNDGNEQAQNTPELLDEDDHAQDG